MYQPLYQVQIPDGVFPGQQFQVRGLAAAREKCNPIFAQSHLPSSLAIRSQRVSTPTQRVSTPTQVNVGGQFMVVTAPEGSQPGSMIQIAAPAAAPTVTGVPVSAGGAAMGVGVAPGVVGVAPGVVIVEAPPEGFVEVDEISPAGWFCLIVGCFFWPGLNLVGLCMRERRLVPASSVGYYY